MVHGNGAVGTIVSHRYGARSNTWNTDDNIRGRIGRMLTGPGHLARSELFGYRGVISAEEAYGAMGAIGDYDLLADHVARSMFGDEAFGYEGGAIGSYDALGLNAR